MTKMMDPRDGTLSTYQARVSAAVAQGRLGTAPLEASEKYLNGRALPFPGLTMISPAGADDPSAGALYQALEEIQRGLCARFSGALIPIRAETFHITGADLIAGAAYLQQIEEAGEADYWRRFRAALTALEGRMVADQKSEDADLPAGRWSLTGFSLFGSALVALLSPHDEAAYDRLTGLRRHLYSDLSLSALGVRAPRPLMAHVTLAYFTHELAADLPLQAALQQALIEENRLLSVESAAPLELSLNQLTLCFFRDMEAYDPLPPPLTFSL